MVLCVGRHSLAKQRRKSPVALAWILAPAAVLFAVGADVDPPKDVVESVPADGAVPWNVEIVAAALNGTSRKLFTLESVYPWTLTISPDGRTLAYTARRDGRDDIWLDAAGNPLTDRAKVTERFRRPNFGNLDISMTVDDPKAYTRPFTVRVEQEIVADGSEMIEFVCHENQKFLKLTGRER